MNNGNGKSTAPPPVVAAQTRVHELERPLQKLNADISALQVKVSNAQKQLAEANEAHADASEQYADNQTAATRQRLQQTHAAVKEVETLCRTLQQRLSKLEAQRPALDAPYQQACVRLQLAMRDWRKEVVANELYAAKFKLAQAQQSVLEAQHKVNGLADEYRSIEQAENKERQSAMTPFAYGGPRGQVVTR